MKYRVHLYICHLLLCGASLSETLHQGGLNIIKDCLVWILYTAAICCWWVNYWECWKEVCFNIIVAFFPFLQCKIHLFFFLSSVRKRLREDRRANTAQKLQQMKQKLNETERKRKRWLYWKPILTKIGFGALILVAFFCWKMYSQEHSL